MTATSATAGCSMSTCSASAGIDVHPARDDHVAEAVRDEHVAVVVDVADLAQGEDAGAEVGVGGLLGVARVHDAPAGGVLEEDPSFRAAGHLVPVVVDHDGREGRDGAADRAGVLEPLLARDHAGGAHLGGAVGVEEHRPPPLDHLALDVDRAGRAGVADELDRADVVAGPHLLGQGQQPGEVRRHHDAGLGVVGVEGLEDPLGVEPAEHHHRDAHGQQPDAREGTGVVHRPDHEVGAEAGERVARQGGEVLVDVRAAGEHGGRQLDALGPTRRARRVHEVGAGGHVGRRLTRVGRGQPALPRRQRPRARGSANRRRGGPRLGVRRPGRSPPSPDPRRAPGCRSPGGCRRPPPR